MVILCLCSVDLRCWVKHLLHCFEQRQQQNSPIELHYTLLQESILNTHAIMQVDMRLIYDYVKDLDITDYYQLVGELHYSYPYSLLLGIER